MERMRVMVCRRAGVDEAPVEGVAGCLRKKSVRISPPLAPLGWGSEMFPNEEPLCRRVDDLWRWAAQRHIIANARSAPATRPGKKPTRTAEAGNLLQDAAVRAVVLFPLMTGITEADCVLVDEVVGDEAVDEGEEEVAVGAAGAEAWLAFMIHWALVLQLYPKGQHAFPQV